MTKHIGQSTTYGNILPNSKALSLITGVSLSSMSKDARHRFRIISYYLKQAKPNIALVCRHYSIARSYFYKWYNRFKKGGIKLLESKSRRPRKLRQATYSTEFVSLVRKLRKDYPSYSAKKLAVIVWRDYGISFSSATIGRIISRFNLFFRRRLALRRLQSKRAKQAWKVRKPYGLASNRAHHIVEFDMKHIYSNSTKNYAFVAVDTFSKQAVIHVAKRPSSYHAQVALEKAVDVFGEGIVIVNDNGSENMGRSYEYLKSKSITQYFARPHTPKDKPHVENLIGKLQQECLDENLHATTVDEYQSIVNRWINDYHYFRPHQSLGYQTPAEFCDKLGITIPHLEVSSM